MQTKLFKSIVSSLIGIALWSAPIAAQVTVYTPFTKVSVPPGETVDYSVEVHNQSQEVQRLDVALRGLPKSWDYELKAGGWKLSQLAVMPGKDKTLSLKVVVPVQVNKGTYNFTFAAGGYTLPLTIVVSEQGTYKTEFSCNQANMEGASSATFTYSASLRNRTADKQLYSLTAGAERGWNVVFRANGKQVTSVEVEPNATTTVTIDMKPPTGIAAGKYAVPITASTGATSAQLKLEAVITGSYSMQLTTPEGLLSTDITAGRTRRLELVVVNNGSSDLKDVEITATKPTKWEVTFEPDKVASLTPNASTQVTAIVKAADKAIPGDYVVKFTARTPETSAAVDFRVAVETSWLAGWVGILLIAAVIAAVVFLFRKYGRR